MSRIIIGFILVHHSFRSRLPYVCKRQHRCLLSQSILIVLDAPAPFLHLFYILYNPMRFLDRTSRSIAHIFLIELHPSSLIPYYITGPYPFRPLFSAHASLNFNPSMISSPCAFITEVLPKRDPEYTLGHLSQLWSFSNPSSYLLPPRPSTVLKP